MNLSLAIVQSCSETGCQVKMVESGELIDAAYSALALNRVPIHRGQLVAIDKEPARPEIVWRWHRWTVLGREGMRVLVGRPGGPAPVEVDTSLDVAIGDEVWVTGWSKSGPWEISGRVERPEEAASGLPRIAPALAALHS